MAGSQVTHNEAESVIQNGEFVFPTKGGTQSIYLGLPGTGKTLAAVCVAKYALERGDVKFGVVFCTTKFSGSWSFLPNDWIIEEYTDDKFLGWVKHLRKMAAKEREKRGPPKPDEPPLLDKNILIADDTLGEMHLNSFGIYDCLKALRHTNTLTHILIQHCGGGIGTSPALRSFTNVLVLYDVGGKGSMKMIYESFACGRNREGKPLFSSLRDFEKHYNKTVAKKYQAMVIVRLANQPSEWFGWTALDRRFDNFKLLIEPGLNTPTPANLTTSGPR